MKATFFFPFVSLPRAARGIAVAIAAMCSALPSATASDPVGVYGFIDKVVLEPNDAEPERIQVWGGFATAGGGRNDYGPAQRGYLYFKLPEGKENAARREWNDLKSLAGKEQLVAFGSRYGEAPKVRKAEAKPENPDSYRLAIGVTKVTPREGYPPHKDLITLRQATKEASPPRS